MTDYGVLFELNGKRVDVSDGELCDVVAKTEVKFIVNSDAHRSRKGRRGFRPDGNGGESRLALGAHSESGQARNFKKTV